MAFEQLLRHLKEIKKGDEKMDKEELELLPIYLNPESEIIRIPKDTFNHLSTLQKISATLTSHNLSKNEARVYLYLARFGPIKALNIAQSLGVHRTEIYKILNRLESRGFVSRVLERPLKFKAIPFENVLEVFISERRQRISQLEKKKSELIDIWKSLPKADKVEKVKQIFQVMESKKQISLKVIELLRKCQKCFHLVIKDSEINWLYHTPFFDNLQKTAKLRKLDVCLVTNHPSAVTYLQNGIEFEKEVFSLRMRKDLPSFFLIDNKEAIIIFKNDKEETSGIWTNYKSILKAYKMLFNFLLQDKK
jgi:sugar-specific transcriptional regulator TrmB